MDAGHDAGSRKAHIGLTEAAPAPGSDFEAMLRAERPRLVRLCRRLTGDAAAASPYVRDELALARDHQILVYPIWVSDTLGPSCVPLGWGQTQYANGSGDRLASEVRGIIASVAKVKGGA